MTVLILKFQVQAKTAKIMFGSCVNKLHALVLYHVACWNRRSTTSKLNRGAQIITIQKESEAFVFWRFSTIISKVLPNGRHS